MERRPPPLPVPFRPVGTGLRPMERSERRVREGKVSEKETEGYEVRTGVTVERGKERPHGPSVRRLEVNEPSRRTRK